MNNQTQTQNIFNFQTLSNSIFDQKESFKFLIENSSTVDQQETLIEILATVPGRTKPVPKKRINTSSNKWTKNETQMFMKLIRIFSVDFEMISQFLVTKTRDQIKRKFKSLEKTNKVQIDLIFRSAPGTPDEQILSRMREILGQN